MFRTGVRQPLGTTRSRHESRETDRQTDSVYRDTTSLGQNRTLDRMLDVFSGHNANTGVRVETLNTTLANFLRPAGILLPRAVRLGARIGF